MYTYQETHDKIKDFLFKTNLQMLCQEICKGRCCKETGCSDCNTGDPRRLGCVTYICQDLIDIFPELEIINRINEQVLVFLDDLIGDINKFYSEDYSDYVKSKILIEKELVDSLDNINKLKIKSNIYSMMKLFR